MTEDLKETIAENAAGPKSGSGDEGSFTQHSLAEQIAADKHLQGSNALKRRNFGLKFVKISPPGATS